MMTLVLKITGRFLLLIGLTLGILQVIGTLTRPIGLRCDQVTEKVVKNYDCRTMPVTMANIEFKRLRARKNELSEETKARTLFKFISDSYVHNSTPYTLMPWDNWYYWAKSKLSSNEFLKTLYSDTQDSTLLWKRGGGFCHQAAWIFVDKARELGLDAHLVRLKNHVVAEYKSTQGWRLIDLDFGILWEHSASELFALHNLKEVVEAEFLKRGFDKNRRKKYAELYLESKDTHRVSNFLYTRTLWQQELSTLPIITFAPLVLIIVGLFITYVERKTR